MTRMRRALVVAAGLGVAALLLYLSLAQVELRQVGAEVARTSVPWLVVSVVVRLSALAIAAARSRVLFAPLGAVSSYRLYKSLVLGFIVQNVIPFRAGELARVSYLARFNQLPASTCLAVVATERLLDVFALLTLFLAVLPAASVELPIGGALYVSGAVAALAVSAAVLVSRHPLRFVSICAALGGLLGDSVGEFVEARSGAFARGFSALGSARSVLGVLLLSWLFWIGSATTI
ncbi:MAG: flippase-like domain-containing protein, partial [Acidobacteriota bacterium]|nr:flippase-like domain-containing protein [Acidobacteriota bacterium]